MDPPKRGADRLARFYEAKRRILPPDVLASKPLRAFMREAGTTSLRTVITGTVVSFVPTALPLQDGSVSCTRAVMAIHASGGFTVGVRVQTSTPDPVAVIVGCCTNNARGAWTAIIGALNFTSDSFATSRTREGIFQTHGASFWLGRNFAEVARTGVTFRMIANRPETPIRALFQAWVRTFEGHLVHQNILHLTDDHPELSVQTLDVAATTSVDPDDAQLRLRGSLIFE
ncbi:MAG TPA: hypothetical protein VEX88_14175 [Glaciibacter sp.]|nr:hypothetical protein [Glaciibacter sp.]